MACVFNQKGATCTEILEQQMEVKYFKLEQVPQSQKLISL